MKRLYYFTVRITTICLTTIRHPTLRRTRGVPALIAYWLIYSSTALASQDNAPAVPQSDLPLELIGTYVTKPASQSFAIISVDKADEEFFKRNDKIIDKATLYEIRANDILIKNAGNIELLKLTENTAAPGTLSIATTDSTLRESSAGIAPGTIESSATVAATLPTTLQPTQNLKDNQPPYRLQPFDKLQITVEDKPDLTMWQTINESGSINYTYLGGLEIAGLTQQETLDLITERLQSGYLQNPVVSISVAKSSSFNIDGEVVNPGDYELIPGLTLESAIKLAGGLTERAARGNIALTRIVNNDRQVYRAGLLDLIEPGDFITIKEGFF